MKFRGGIFEEPLSHLAAQHNKPNTLHLLVKYGYDIAEKSIVGESALHLAALFDSIDVVEMLLDSHPEMMYVRSTTGTPYSVAKQWKRRSTVERMETW